MIGKFIVFEGSDGSGKSTNIQILTDNLHNKGYNVILTREPGGSPLGEKIRSLVLNEEMCPLAELLLFGSQRAEHIEKVIKPALQRGDIVISDRFSDSMYAYQGARGYHKEVLQLEEFVHHGFEPDYTLFFDITLEESFKRQSLRDSGGGDRFERELKEYKKKVYEGYIYRFNMKSFRMVRIDAMPTPDKVAEQIIQWSDKVFEPK